jgi:hypothetical protein
MPQGLLDAPLSRGMTPNRRSHNVIAGSEGQNQNVRTGW